jgi:hypothetical protein
MKKFYLGFSTLICLSVLFALASCTTDSPLVESDTIGMSDAKKENFYYTPRKGDTVLATESLSTNTVTMQADETVDPDWKKLITHFTGTTGSNE